MDLGVLVARAVDSAMESIRQKMLLSLAGTDPESSLIDVPIGDQIVPFDLGVPRSSFDEAIASIADHIQIDSLSDATRKAIEAASVGKDFDWRTQFNELDDGPATEIRKFLYSTFWNFNDELLEFGAFDEINTFLTKTWQVQLLTQVGETLFGSVWPSELARALSPYSPKQKLDSGTLRRWLRGEYRAPPWAWSAMVELLRRKAAEQSLLADRLQRLQNPSP